MSILALTMGEPSGIGGDLTLAVWSKRRELKLPPFFVIDDPRRLKALSLHLGLKVEISEIGSPAEGEACFGDALPVLPCLLASPSEPGKLNQENGPAVRRSIETAVELIQQGLASAVVTNPIHKKVLNDAGFPFPGHTEFLADLAGIRTPPVMMLACEALKVVPVTVHVSLADATRSLTTEMIIAKAEITARALSHHFGIGAPRLAVAGLNPHAGEGGHMGLEDEAIVRPAVEDLRRRGINAVGPLPSDTLFHERARRTYDAAICMYHDQALIPIKTIDFDNGVNITLGLPFIRTSPDHGTALDLAGTGEAETGSLVAAMKMAAQMAGMSNG